MAKSRQKGEPKVAKPLAPRGVERLGTQELWRRSGEPIGWGPLALESAQPELVQLMLSVLAAWVELESVVAEAYAILLFGEEPTALALFLAFDRADQRAKMFKATAAIRLKGTDLEAECRTLLGEYQGGSKDRVLVAHGLWAVATAESIADAILYIDVRERTTRIFDICRGRADLNAEDMIPDSFHVFRRVDFQDMIDLISELRGRWFAFVQRLIVRGRAIASQKDQHREETLVFGDYLAPAPPQSANPEVRQEPPARGQSS